MVRTALTYRRAYPKRRSLDTCLTFTKPKTETVRQIRIDILYNTIRLNNSCACAVYTYEFSVDHTRVFIRDKYIYIYIYMLHVGYNAGLWFCRCTSRKVFGEKSVIKHSDAHDDDMPWREQQWVGIVQVQWFWRTVRTLRTKVFVSVPLPRVRRRDHSLWSYGRVGGIATLRRSGPAVDGEYVRARVYVSRAFVCGRAGLITNGLRWFGRGLTGRGRS